MPPTPDRAIDLAPRLPESRVLADRTEPFRPPHDFECSVCYPASEASATRLLVAFLGGFAVLFGVPFVFDLVRGALIWFEVLP